MCCDNAVFSLSLQHIYNFYMQEAYIKILQTKRIWNIDFVVDITKSIYAARSLMATYSKKQIVSSVRRDMYVANDLATGTAMVDKFEIASNIVEGGYVAYHSALEFYGLGHQQLFAVYVASPKRFRGFSFENIDYVSSQNKIQEGVVTPPMNSLVRVSCLERTVVDCLDRIDLAGGVDELLNCLSSCQRLDIDKLISLASLYNKQVLYRKVGIICEIFAKQWNVSNAQIELLKAKGGNTTQSFTDRSESTRFLKQWRMHVPEEIITYFTDSENNDII